MVVQIPLVDKFRWPGWYVFFHGIVQMTIVTVLFKEEWTDLKRASIDCKKLSILNGIAVPIYVSLQHVSVVVSSHKLQYKFLIHCTCICPYTNFIYKVLNTEISALCSCWQHSLSLTVYLL